jgi:hypothetical protein
MEKERKGFLGQPIEKLTPEGPDDAPFTPKMIDRTEDYGPFAIQMFFGKARKD